MVRRLSLAVVATAAVAVVAVTALNGPGALQQQLLVSSAVPTYSFAESSVVGGGFQNVIAADPRHNGVVLSGADTAGIFRSTDNGVHFVPSDGGFADRNDTNISAFAFDPANPDTVYAAVGRQVAGGVLVSNDDGRTWASTGSGPTFNGDNKDQPTGGTGMERCTGQMIAIDDTTSPHTVYVASFNGGVWKRQGSSWQRIVTQAQLGGAPCSTSLALSGRTLIDATWGAGAYRIALANGNAVTAVAGAPGAIQEVVALADGDVWASAYLSGIGEFGATIGAWRGEVAGGGAHFMSIAGYSTSTTMSGDVVIAGSDTSAAVTGSTLHSSLQETRNGGGAWTPLPATSGGISANVLGTSGSETWWHSTTTGSGGMLGTKSFIPSSIVVAHGADSDDIWVSGSGGDWRLLGREGQTTFYPAVLGLGVTVQHQVVIDPATMNAPRSEQRVMSGDTDWIFFNSADGDTTQSGLSNPRPSGSGSAGFLTAIDSGPAVPVVYLGSANRDNDTQGEVFAASMPATSGAAYTAVGLGRVAGGHRPLAIGIIDGAGATPTLVIPVETGGVYVRSPGGTWAHDTTLFMGDQHPEGAIASSGQTVYAFDANRGVYRSTDVGAPGSWKLIFTATAGAGTPGLLVDPSNSSTLWVSTGNGVYRITNATTTATASAALLRGDVGPLAAHAGRIYTTNLTPGGGLAFDSADASAANPAFVNVGDTFLANDYANISGIAIAGDGTAYLAASGAGLIVGRPSTAGPAPTPTPTATATATSRPTATPAPSATPRPTPTPTTRLTPLPTATPRPTAKPTPQPTTLKLTSLSVTPTTLVSDVVINFRTSTTSSVTIDVVSANGDIVRHLETNQVTKPGATSITYYGYGGPDGKLSKGKYVIVVVATAGSNVAVASAGLTIG